MFSYEVIVIPALWIVFGLGALGFLLRGVTRTTRTIEGVEVGKYGYNGRFARRAGYVVIIGVLVLTSLVVTPPGHRGVIYSATGGISTVERAEGLSLIFPIIQTAKQINVREQRFFTDVAFSQSKDLQEITVHVAVGWAVAPTKAAELYQEIGTGPVIEEVLIFPAVFQFVKERVGLIKAEDFAAERGQLADDVFALLVTELEPAGLRITYVSIVDAVFDEAFMLSVKNKIIAEQAAIEEFNNIAKAANIALQVAKTAEGEEQKRLIEARGEAEAIRQVASTLGFTPAEYLAWVKVSRWDGVLPTTLLGEAGDFGLIIEAE